MTLDMTHPALVDLESRARRRLPRFIWEFLDSANGDEGARRSARAALDGVALVPRMFRGLPEADLAVTLLNRRQALPFGISPVGMSGLIWPGGEEMLARVAATQAIPYGLSCVTAATPEEIGPVASGEGWFQLYPPKSAEVRRDLLKRAKDSGFRTLILTADVAAPSRRERQRRARLTTPAQVTPSHVFQAALCPAWSRGILKHGIPDLKTLLPYVDPPKRSLPSTAHVGSLLRAAPDWPLLDSLRAEWDGPLVVKGVLHPDDAQRIAKVADAVWVSNHGGRQFEAAPAPVSVLEAIRQAVGDSYPLIADGEVRSAADILRLIALGADFVMIGRAFHWGLGAFGEAGAAHVVSILREGLIADLGQLGVSRPSDLRGLAERTGMRN